MGAAADLAKDQAGRLQHPDVLGCGCERHGAGRGEFADAARPVGQMTQHGAARGVAEGVKDGVEAGGHLLNHVVEHDRLAVKCQPIG